MLHIFSQLLTWEGVVEALIEITLLSAMIYLVLSFLQGTRGAGILRGLIAVFLITVVISIALTETWKLTVLNWLVQNVIGFLVIALVIIFQPELRNALLRVGQSPVFTHYVRERWDPSGQIVRAVAAMSRERTGALIAVERTVGLKSYLEGATPLDAQVSAELLQTIFKRGSPLHDGAVIIRGGRVLAAACLFPLSENPNLDSVLGTRHRAAVGVTEESDAMAIVVSEETGDISVAQNGTLTRQIDERTLARLLRSASSGDASTNEQTTMEAAK